MVATAYQHGVRDSGGFKSLKPAQRKPLKGGQKEQAHREGHMVWAGFVKTFQNVGDVKTAPLACEHKAT
jgi:hypothetical protein